MSTCFQWKWAERTFGLNFELDFVLWSDFRQEGWTGQELRSDAQVARELAAASEEIPEGATYGVEEQAETWIGNFPRYGGRIPKRQEFFCRL